MYNIYNLYRNIYIIWRKTFMKRVSQESKIVLSLLEPKFSPYSCLGRGFNRSTFKNTAQCHGTFSIEKKWNYKHVTSEAQKTTLVVAISLLAIIKENKDGNIRWNDVCCAQIYKESTKHFEHGWVQGQQPLHHRVVAGPNANHREMRIGIVDYEFIFELNPLDIPSPRYAVHRAPLATGDVALVTTGHNISIHNYDIREYTFR